MPEAWTGDTALPWGKHKGVKLKDVPLNYLGYLSEQPWIKDWPALNQYLINNASRIASEVPKRTTSTDEEFKSFDDYKAYRGF